MKSTGSDELPVVARPWRGAWSPPRPRCGSDPWFWKDFHVSGGSWWYWWGRMATAVALTLLALFFCSRSISGRYVEPVIVLTMIGWFVWMMFEVGQVLTVEFQDRMWSTVRITPNSVATILAHKMRAFALKLAPSFLPLGVVLAFGLTTYAHLVVLVGLPVLLMASFPFAALILYGSAIPQTLIGGGWRMVRTLAPVGMVIFLAGFVCTCSDAIPFDVRAVVLWSMFLVMSIGVTTWIYFSTLWELNDPSRERLSSDGG